MIPDKQKIDHFSPPVVFLAEMCEAEVPKYQQTFFSVKYFHLII